MIKELINLNDMIVNLMENSIVKYIYLIYVIIRILSIQYVSTSFLENYDTYIIKIVYALLIAYFACFDPVYSIAFTTLIIISLQELYNRRGTHNLQASTKVQPKYIKSKQMIKYEHHKLPSHKYLANNESINNIINKNIMQKQSSNEDKLIANYDFYDDPAFKTITANVSDNSYLARNKFIVLGEDLKNAQTNQTPGSNQYVSVQELQGDILNIQGLPNGFDPSFRSK
uniref:Uncharacterized protein n=1 Tax=viral metagenome TaxID=1070528 RepID=A0A6C0F353_9ZZZZ